MATMADSSWRQVFHTINRQFIDYATGTQLHTIFGHTKNIILFFSELRRNSTITPSNEIVI